MEDLFPYPKGSEWRKWDLHVHTPSSILHNNFGDDWDNYVNNLFNKAIGREIAVIGITDYFCIEGYRKIKNEYLDNEDKLNELFDEETIDEIKRIKVLPNIELRLNKFVGESRINFHIIFSDNASMRDIEENFLHELEFTFQGRPQSADEKWKLKIDNLKVLGEKLKREHSEFKSDSDLFVGMKNAVVDDSQLVNILNNKPTIFGGKYLLIIPSDEDLSEVDWDSQDHQTRKILIQKSDLIFSSNKNTIQWGLGYKHTERKDFKEEFKSFKPCIWGSDAHSFDELFEPDYNRFTWIKADPTFEGLKQIVYEPEARVNIGEEPPLKIDEGNMIDSILIENSNNWFNEGEQIFLNENMVSIIGGKGTGKTALLDLISYATNSYIGGNKSFLDKAKKKLKGTKVKVLWKDGNTSEEKIEKTLEKPEKESKIRYLQQDFIEELCSEIGKEKLEKQVENVIFQKIPKEEKATYSNFKNLKNEKLKIINSRKQRIRDKIKQYNLKIQELHEAINTKGEIKERIKKNQEKIKEMKDKISTISEKLEEKKEQKGILDRITELNKEKTDLEQEISSLNNKNLIIEEIKEKLDRFMEDKNSLVNNLKKDLEEVEFDKEITNKIKITLYPTDIEEILEQFKKKLENKIDERKKSLIEKREEITKTRKTLKLEETKQEKINNINTLINTKKQKIESLKTSLDKIKENEEMIPTLEKERKELYFNFFQLLFEEKEKLSNLYSPVEDHLARSDEENEKLFEFSIEFYIDTQKMADEGDNIINHKVEGEFFQKTTDFLYRELEDFKFKLDLNREKLTENDRAEINNFLTNIANLFKNSDEHKSLELKKKLKDGYSEEDFYNWLYSTKYYNIYYSIKFNGTELNNLSPGLKGVALLILYLELDKEDTRPILIDQPEENLDNRSVYKTLVEYFRNAKQRRQIIIVTHNPNLVVNTDSEQIIVSNFDKNLENQPSRIYYVSGALENSFKLKEKEFSAEEWNQLIELEKKGIREHICEILEGGEKAFEDRERKYGFAK